MCILFIYASSFKNSDYDLSVRDGFTTLENNKCLDICGLVDDLYIQFFIFGIFLALQNPFKLFRVDIVFSG